MKEYFVKNVNSYLYKLYATNFATMEEYMHRELFFRIKSKCWYYKFVDAHLLCDA